MVHGIKHYTDITVQSKRKKPFLHPIVPFLFQTKKPFLLMKILVIGFGSVENIMDFIFTTEQITGFKTSGTTRLKKVHWQIIPLTAYLTIKQVMFGWEQIGA